MAIENEYQDDKRGWMANAQKLRDKIKALELENETIKAALRSWVREWEAWEGSDGEGSRMNLEVAEMRLEFVTRPYLNPDADSGLLFVGRDIQQEVLDEIDRKGD